MTAAGMPCISESERVGTTAGGRSSVHSLVHRPVGSELVELKLDASLRTKHSACVPSPFEELSGGCGGENEWCTGGD